MARRLAVVALMAALAFTPACGDGASGPPSVPGGAVWVEDPFSGGYPTYDDEATGLRVVFGTPDLGAGASRVSFALFDFEGLVSYPALNVQTRFYPDGPEEGYRTVEEAALTFAPFPDGGRGIYTGTLALAEPGLWAIDAAVPQADGTVARVVFPVEVSREPSAPAVGDPAPASVNRTADDVDDLRALTTATTPDPALYDATIARVLDEGRPFVLTFASPAFCTNALCGPQVEVLSALREQYGPDAEFIHVELYENPIEIRGDLSVARRTPVLEEWGILTDEWTFVVDASGRVTARLEGFAPYEEVEAALLDVIRPG